MNWKYKRVEVEEGSGPVDKIEETMNSMGQKGWELKSSYRVTDADGFAKVSLLFGKQMPQESVSSEEPPKTLLG